jgi:hypothetical protein
MNKIILFLLVIFLIVNKIHAQYINVKINTITVGSEEWIAMNPKNTNQLVVGIHNPSFSQQSNMYYFSSSNGGLNWSYGTLLSTLAQPGSDPVILVDTSGYFYYFCVANWGIPPPNGDKLLCLKSTDGGINWNNGTAFGVPYPKMNDMPMACVDFSYSPYKNNIYVTWTLLDSLHGIRPYDSSYVYFCRSTDEGSTFSTPIRISKIAGHANWDITTPEGPVPCTGTNGEIYVCYPYNQNVLFNRSTDGGITWLNNEIIASTQPGGWLMTHSPVIVCDLSNSQYSGNVYICFSDLRTSSSDRDIWLIKSTNRGNNWSSPVRVNNDSPGHYQYLPWICIDRITGYIWIVFYDSRNYSNSSHYDTYVARSTDGGNTFQNVKVSDANSSTLAYWLGDYIGIAAYNNIVRPVWTTSFGTGTTNLWTAIIDTFTIGIRPISSEVPNRFMLYQNYPNPFNPSTNIKYQITKNVKSETSNVKLIIFDILGKEVTTLVNEKQSPGTYEVNWDGTNYPSGVYFYTLTAGDFVETKKMLMIK